MVYMHGRFEYENVKTISSAINSATKLKNDLIKLKIKIMHTKDTRYYESLDKVNYFILQLQEFIQDYMICLQKSVQCHAKTLVNSIFIFLAIFKDIDEFSKEFMIDNKRLFIII